MVILKEELKKGQHRVFTVINDNKFKVEMLRMRNSEILFRDLSDPPPVDLLFVDLCVNPQDGLELIKRLRVEGVPAEIIAYIRPDDSKTLKQAMRMGVIDCLTAPLDIRRLKVAINRFLKRTHLLEQGQEFTQEMIDNLLCTDGQDMQDLPKGLQQKTLDTIRTVFNSRPEKSFTCNDVVESVNLSRITVQRYLSYLHENNELDQDINYDTGGRPCSLYTYNLGVFA